MKIAHRFLMLLIAAFSITTLHAQTADEIFSKHIDAVGGKERLSGINSIKIEANMQVMGNDAPTNVVVLNGKGYRSESEFNGAKIIQVYTDRGGWMVNPMAGANTPTEMPEEQVKGGQAQIYVIPYLDYAAKGGKVEYLGQQKIGEVNAYKVKLTDKNGLATTYFFDPSNYYMIQATRTAEMMGQQMDLTMTFSDFKKTDYGWVMAQTTNVNMGGQFDITSKINKVEVNTAVDEKIFDMPAK
jgi:hypothetical protein